MAEIWGAAIAMGGAVIGGIAKSKQAKQDRKNANADAKAANADEAKWGSILSQFENEQEYRYEQIRRQNKQRGLDEFRKFNSLGEFAPDYQQTHNGIVVPDANSVAKISDAYDKEQQAINQANGANSGSGGGGSKSFLDKIDPLGAALGKKDPVRKALSKLF